MLRILPFVNGPLTPGERGILLSYVTVALYGLAFGFTIVMTKDADALLVRPLSVHEKWTIAAGGIGMCFGLWSTKDRIGCLGPIRTAVSMVFLCIIGAITAGTLALPVYGTMFAPMALIVMLFASPFMMGLWLLSLAAVHRLMGQWHHERDSIFGPQAAPSWIPRPILWAWARLRSYD